MPTGVTDTSLHARKHGGRQSDWVSGIVTCVCRWIGLICHCVHKLMNAKHSWTTFPPSQTRTHSVKVCATINSKCRTTAWRTWSYHLVSRRDIRCTNEYPQNLVCRHCGFHNLHHHLRISFNHHLFCWAALQEGLLNGRLAEALLDVRTFDVCTV